MATAVTTPPAGPPTSPAIAVPAAGTVPAAEPARDRAGRPLAVPVTLLRAGAALLGVYGYLVTLWLARHGSHPEPIATVREWLNRPLGVAEDFGPLAVMLLLAATGYLAAARGFGGWRLVRAYLPVLVVTVLAAAAVLAGIDVWTTPPDASVTAPNVVANLTFASHLVAAKTVLVPLAWVAGLQLVAWLVALDRRTWPTVLVLLAATGVLCLFAGDLTHLGRPLLFLPLVLVGHVTWRVLDRTLPLPAGMLLVAACFAAIIAVDRTFAGLEQWWYPVAATYAVLLLLVAVRAAGPTAATIAAHPVTRWLADRAEWLVLLGGVVGFAVLEPLRGTVPVPLGMVAALAAVGLAADACHRLTGVITKAERA
jgi:hypothetical protein